MEEKGMYTVLHAICEGAAYATALPMERGDEGALIRNRTTNLVDLFDTLEEAQALVDEMAPLYTGVYIIYKQCAVAIAEEQRSVDITRRGWLAHD